MYDQTGSIEASEELAGEEFNRLYEFYCSMYAPVSRTLESLMQRCLSSDQPRFFQLAERRAHHRGSAVAVDYSQSVVHALSVGLTGHRDCVRI